MAKSYFSPTKITHLVAIFFGILFLFASCRREAAGDLCFENRTNEPIDLYIDGFYELTIDTGDGACIYLGNGCWDWYAEGIFSGFFSEGVGCISNGGFGSTIIIED